MRLTAVYDGRDDPFEGDRTILLQALPEGALVSRAVLSVRPGGDAGGERLTPAPAGTTPAFPWSGTTTVAGDAVEVDLHARRTLARVAGTDLAHAVLTVDVGGLYVDLNERGALKTPDDPDVFHLTPDGTGEAPLPGVAAARFRLTRNVPADPTPGVSAVVVRSPPGNLTARLATLGPFWTRFGDLTAPDRSPDFAAILQAYLGDAAVADGAYVIPITVHADGIARLEVGVEIEFLQRAPLLPAGLGEVTFEYGLARDPKGAVALVARLPAGAVAAPGHTGLTARGAFASSRIAQGTPDFPPPAGAAPVTPGLSPAQAVRVTGAEDVHCTAIDLLVTPEGPAATVSITILSDADGKPSGGDPLLARPVDAERVTRREDRAPQWVSATLPAPFTFQRGVTYWLLVQAVDGDTTWPAGPAPSGLPGLQTTADGGMSWRAVTHPAVAGPLVGGHRLRVTPERFRMPVSLGVGPADARTDVPLERFEPLGRVDFAIDMPEVAGAITDRVVAAPACPDGESLTDGEFATWTPQGDTLGAAQQVATRGGPWALGVLPVDRRVLAAGVELGDGEVPAPRATLTVVEPRCLTAVGAIALEGGQPGLVAAHPDGTWCLVATGRDITEGDQRPARVAVTGLEVVDLTPAPVAAGRTAMRTIEAVGLGPGGGRLYLARIVEGAVTTVEVTAVDAAAARAGIRAGTGLPAPAPVASVPVVDAADRLGAVPHLAVLAGAAGDAVCLVIEADDAPGRAHLLRGDAGRVDMPLGLGPHVVATSADRRRAIIGSRDARCVHIVDAAAGRAVRIDLRGPRVRPIAVALCGDGSRAAVVAVADDDRAADLVLVDVTTRRTIGTLPVAASVADVAMDATGRQVFVADPFDGLTAVQVGIPVPAEWTVTSGGAEPACPDGRPAIHLGPSPRPSSISQTVSAAGGCAYAFAFRAAARGAEGAAEVLWLDDTCGLLRTDALPIAPGDPGPRLSKGGGPDLAPRHRALTAPAGARQAEVRFRVPVGGEAWVAEASLAATSERSVNPTLGLGSDGAPDGWLPDGDGAPRVSVTGASGGAVLDNPSPAAVAVTQACAVTGSSPYVLEFEGRALAHDGPERGDPAVGIAWSDASGAPVDEPRRAAVTRSAFDRLMMSGTVPAAATVATLRLEVPPGASLEVRRVVLSQPAQVEVPLAFSAQAPGTLTASSAVVAYDIAPRPAPAPPPGGLCEGTPPGEAPARTHDRPCCCCCGSEGELADEVRALTPGGRAARAGRCSTCGAEVVIAGGIAAGARRPVEGAALPVRAGTAVRRVDVESIAGVGPARALALGQVGLGTAARLALADPDLIAAYLVGISPTGARALIAEAARLATPDPP